MEDVLNACVTGILDAEPRLQITEPSQADFFDTWDNSDDVIAFGGRTTYRLG